MGEELDSRTVYDPVSKSIKVKLPIDKAFALFTEGIASWWPLESHSVGEEKTIKCIFEGEVGGRIYEVQEDGNEAEWGRVKTWDPPDSVVFTWYPGREADTAQDVDVKFTSIEDGTELQLVHSGWELLGDQAHEMREGYDSGWDYVLGHYYADVNK